MTNEESTTNIVEAIDYSLVDSTVEYSSYLEPGKLSSLDKLAGLRKRLTRYQEGLRKSFRYETDKQINYAPIAQLVRAIDSSKGDFY